jgi:hypothetical protein
MQSACKGITSNPATAIPQSLQSNTLSIVKLATTYLDTIMCNIQYKNGTESVAKHCFLGAAPTSLCEIEKTILACHKRD